MPFSDEPHTVAGFAKDVKAGGNAREVVRSLNIGIIAVFQLFGERIARNVASAEPVVNAVRGRHSARNKTASCGRADGRGAKKVFKIYSLVCKTVKIRGDYFGSFAPESPRALIV